MKISVYIAVSLDGFIARPDGDVSWLNYPEFRNAFEDYGYIDFFESVDCIIIGTNSLKEILNQYDWPYPGKRVFVLSHSIKEVPPQDIDKYELFSGHLSQLMNKIRKEGYQHLYIDGGKTIQSFFKEKLITDMAITTVPIILGNGISLFGKNSAEIKFTLIESKSYTNGFVKSVYHK